MLILKFVPQVNCLKCCSSMATLGHMQMCAPQRSSQILTLHHQIIITCLVLLKKACEDTIMQWQGAAKCHVTVAVEEEQKLLPGRNTCLCSKVERDLTKIETEFYDNYAFGNVAVKFCEIFTCPPSPSKAKKKNRRYYFQTSPCIITYSQK